MTFYDVELILFYFFHETIVFYPIIYCIINILENDDFKSSMKTLEWVLERFIETLQ